MMANSEMSPPQPDIPHRRMWFGTAGAAVAWVTLGVMDILINWRACQHQEDFGLAPAQIGARILIGALGALMLLIALACGWTAYRNWRAVSRQKSPVNAPAVQRPEYMAVVGMIVTVTMGMGIVWLTLTPIFLTICWRAK